MKLNKIALAVIASAATAASAGVTVTPLLLGYHYTDQAQTEQRKVLTVGKQLEAGSSNGNEGVALENGLYTGAAVGIELTPSTQVQVEYGVANANAKSSKASWDANPANRFDAEQETISANLLVGSEQFTGYTDGNFKPYVLVGGGVSKTTVKNKEAYSVNAPANQSLVAGQPYYPAGSVVAAQPANGSWTSANKVVNAGVGGRYFVNDALALRGEARATYNIDNKWWEGLALAGLEVTLGGRLTPAVPVPPPITIPAQPVETVQPTTTIVEPVVVDSDGDGVPDHLDACPNTPRNLAVDARGCPISERVEDALRMELRVFFDYDKSAIKPQYREEVAKVAEKMREYPNATATIEGHASRDSARSNARYNQRLSEARANAVKSMLSNEFGIAPNRLNAVGYGFDRPIAPNTTPEGRAQNRRVYAVIEGSKTETINRTR